MKRRERTAGAHASRLIGRRQFVLLSLAAALPTVSRGQATAWPQKPVRIIVPYSSGGMADFVARHVGQILSRELGRPVIVENKPGGGSNIGSDVVAKSTPDGYTLLMATSANAINVTLIRKTPYDLLRDLAPISIICNGTTVLVVPASSQIRTVAEFLQLARKHPDALTYGTPGIGSPGHLAAEHLAHLTGAKLRHIPFQGGSAALQELLPGRLDAGFLNLEVVQSHLVAGKLRALGVTQAARTSVLPDAPPIAESGVPGYDWTAWLGLMAPAGTPPAVLGRLQRALTALKAPESLGAIRARGGEPVVSTAAVFKERLQADVTRYAKVITEAGIEAE